MYSSSCSSVHCRRCSDENRSGFVVVAVVGGDVVGGSGGGGFLSRCRIYVEAVVIFIAVAVGFLKSEQGASISQGRIYSDNCTCCHAEIQVGN